MKNLDDIMKNFYDEYRENPQGWSFWTDKSGEFYDIYVLHENKSFFIKIDSIYSKNAIGIGTEISVKKDQLEKNLPDFGFRPFKKNELDNFFRKLSSLDTEEQKKDLMEKQMRKKPTLPENAGKKEYMMLGPFYHGKPFRYQHDEHEKVDKELKKKLKQKFRKKYPMYR